MNFKPRLPNIADNGAETDRSALATAMTAVEGHEAQDAADRSGDEAESDIKKTADEIKQQRDTRRADAVQCVLNARKHDGRGDEPISSHDAGVIWHVAELLHSVAGRGVEKRPESAMAQTGVASTRRTDVRVEDGLAAGTSTAG